MAIQRGRSPVAQSDLVGPEAGAPPLVAAANAASNVADDGESLSKIAPIVSNTDVPPAPVTGLSHGHFADGDYLPPRVPGAPIAVTRLVSVMTVRSPQNQSVAVQPNLMVRHKTVCVLLTDSAGQLVATHGPRTGDSFEFSLAKLRFPEGDPAVQGTPPHSHLLRHADEVLSAAFSPGGEALITGDGRRTREVTRGSLHYWNTATGEQVGPPLEFPNPVANVQITPDGKRVIVLSSATTPASVQKTGRFTEEEAVHVYELPSLRPLYAPLPHLGEAHLLSLSRDGESMLVAGSLDLQARLWSVSTGKAIGKPLQHDAGVTAAALSPDGRLAVTAAFDGSLRVWNTDTQDEIHRPIPASELRSDPMVESVAISRDGRLLASVDTAGRVKLWTLPEAQPVCAPIELKPTVVALSFDPAGKLLLTASMNGAMQLWSAEDGSSIGPSLSEEGNLFGACFSADGSLILGKTFQGIRVWHSPAP